MLEEYEAPLEELEEYVEYAGPLEELSEYEGGVEEQQEYYDEYQDEGEQDLSSLAGILYGRNPHLGQEQEQEQDQEQEGREAQDKEPDVRQFTLMISRLLFRLAQV
jgi:hypothetical protein